MIQLNNQLFWNFNQRIEFFCKIHIGDCEKKRIGVNGENWKEQTYKNKKETTSRVCRILLSKVLTNDGILLIRMLILSSYRLLHTLNARFYFFLIHWQDIQTFGTSMSSLFSPILADFLWDLEEPFRVTYFFLTLLLLFPFV